MKDVKGTTHYYLTQSGKVVCETIGTGSTAKVLDFIYDESGRPFALKYSTNGGSSFSTYYYVLNLQGDVVKLISASGTVYANYTYNAWGEILSSSGTMAEINPLRYRGYYYDRETGWYYLQSRYYDPSMHRFINADTFASTGQGLLGCNMFAYCNNNPVTRVDSSGQSWSDLWDFIKEATVQVGRTIEAWAPAYAACGGAAVADGPLLVGDIFAIIGAAAITVGAIGYSVYKTASEEEAGAVAIPKKVETPVVFPANPNSFNPVGLTKVQRTGTKNGAFISWMDPLTNREVFRWDENPNYSNGPHYHILGTGHYYPGMIVPEPYASIYFPYS